LRLPGRLRGERGYSLIEMVTVMLILSIVMTGITTVFVQGSNAELSMNNRFQAQTNARVGLDKIRKEIHCSSAVTSPAASGSWVTSVTFTDPCLNSTASNLTWCTATVNGDIGLYRNAGSTCSSASPSIRQVDRLTSTAIFLYQAVPPNSLAVVVVNLPVNTVTAKNLTSSTDTYRICDAIALRNSTRGATSGTTYPACP
jgi:prepilin-type N-terminal cleavage/methylation domain-containing protein